MKKYIQCSIIALILVVVGCKGVIISLPAYGNNITRALGISNLKISTTILTTGVSRCGWRYGGEFDGGSFYISAFVRCYNYTAVNETITCVNNAGTVTSQLILLQPQYKDLNINMQCSPSPSYSVNIILKACPTSIISPGVILSKQSTSPCGYGCTARFSCAAGYTGNTVDATCNEQATWSPAPKCLLVYPYLTINLPTTNNKTTRALGISNLKISTTISTTGVSRCGWRYGGEFDVSAFYSFVGCSNYTGVNETITCVNNAGTVTSQLTLLQPQYKDLNINMQFSPSPSYSVNIVLKACSSPTTNNVPVNPFSGFSNTQAIYQCSHGSTLFHVNGTTGNTATKCLATAEWENVKIVQCWAEPTAVLSGAIIYKVGERATFQCTTSNVVPAVYKVEIYFSGIKQVTGNTWTSNPLDISNDEDIVECRAINNYTAKPEYANFGRSNKTISIIYPPQKFKVTNALNNICLWEIGTTQYCNITFKLKPPFYTTNLTKNGKLVTSDLIEMQRINETQSFVYMKNEVMMNDTGIYTLTVKSTVFPAVVFVFGITVVDNTMSDLNSKDCNSDAVIVGSCLAVVILIITTIALHLHMKLKNITENAGRFKNVISVNYKNDKITTTLPKNENNTPQYFNPANKQQAGDNEVGYINLNAGEPIPNDDVIVRNYEVVKTDYEEIMQSNKKPKNEMNEYDL